MTGRLEKPTCFVICPFGAEGTPERERSDKVVNMYIDPVAKSEGYDTFRSIDYPGSRPGLVNDAVFERLHDADLVVADLTGSNANVYYELALRHATGRPFIMLVEDPTELKYDIQGFNAITIRWDFAGGKRTERELRDQIGKIKRGEVKFENPASKLFPCGPKRAKVFSWSMNYMNRLANDWLSRQDSEFLECAKRYDTVRGIPDNFEYRDRLAHYKGFKEAQGQVLSGRLYYQIIDLSGSFEGWGNFGLPGTPIMAIHVIGRERSLEEIEMHFSQPARQLEIAPGIMGNIDSFNFRVIFFKEEGTSLAGNIEHPSYPAPNVLLLGETRLSLIE